MTRPNGPFLHRKEAEIMITGKDIADATGFALSTVEKVLRGHSARYKINPATTRNILETARKLGYHRNEAAVITRTGVNRTVGIFALQTSDMHAVQSKIISGIVSEAAHHDYSVTMFDTQNSLEKSFGALLSKRIRNIIYLAERNPEKCRRIADFCRDNGLAPVFVTEGQKNRVPVVMTDDRNGMKTGIRYLLANGHRRIAVITADYYPERFAAAQEAFQEAGISWDPDFCIVHRTGITFAELAGRIDRILAGTHRPEAFSCITDDVAMMVMMLAYRRGIRIPDELSVIGYGNAYPIIQYAMAPLTTVGQPFQQLGETAFRVAAGLPVDVRKDSEGRYLVPTTLIERESVKNKTQKEKECVS